MDGSLGLVDMTVAGHGQLLELALKNVKGHSALNPCA